MRRTIVIFCMSAILLAGCHQAYENPYRVDTVVRIPVDPTEMSTNPPATEPPPAETEPETTEAPKKTTGSATKKNTAGKGTSSGGKTKPTVPKETKPPETVPPTEAPFEPEVYVPGAMEYQILEYINLNRSVEGMEALPMDLDLSTMAAIRSYEVSQVWSHSRPDGRDFASVLEDYGYSCSITAENIIYSTGEGEASVLVDKWMSSDAHCANILSDQFSCAGVGMYHTGGTTYITVLFAG